MSVTNRFNLVLSNKISNNTCNASTTPNYLRKFANQTDSFESSTKKNQISFKGAQKIPAEIQKMISSNNYWKILGATIATTATALWAKITNNGQNDADLTVEEIENKIRENLPEIFQEQEAEATEITEEVIDIEAKKINEEAKENTTLTLEENKPSEAPKKRRGRPPKNLKLEGGQQPDTSKAVPAKRRQQAGDVELIKTLAEQGLTVSEIEAETGIKVQQIKRIAKKENITIVDARKKAKKQENIEKTADISSKEDYQAEKSPKRKYTYVTEEIYEEVVKLAEENIPQYKISEITGISPASISRILSGDFQLKKSLPVKQLRENFEKELNKIVDLCKYTPEEYFKKYIAKSYQLYLKNYGEEKLLNFAINKEPNSIELLSKEKDILGSILYAKDTIVPENDSIYEDYKNCYDKESFISKFIAHRNQYIEQTLNTILQTEEYAEIQKSTENISPEKLLDILCDYKITRNYQKNYSTQDNSNTKETVESKLNNMDYDSLILELEKYYELTESNKELHDRLIDFTANCQKSDIDTLRTFIYLLENFSNKKMTADEVNEICNKSFIIPLNSEIKNSSNVEIEEIIPSGPAKITVEKLYDLGDEAYIKFINGEVLNNEPFKNFARKRYLEALKSNDPISLEDAVQAMKRIDEYLLLSAEEKTHIANIEKIFNTDITQVKLRTKSQDNPNNIFVKVLDEIIKKDYLKTKTLIYNTSFKEYVTFPPEFKEEVYKNEKTFYIEIFKELEKAATQSSSNSGEIGIEKWKNKKHSLELRLVGTFGRVRAYSNYLLNGEKNFVFTRYVSDHKKRKKN